MIVFFFLWKLIEIEIWRFNQCLAGVVTVGVVIGDVIGTLAVVVGLTIGVAAWVGAEEVTVGVIFGWDKNWFEIIWCCSWYI